MRHHVLLVLVLLVLVQLEILETWDPAAEATSSSSARIALVLPGI
jgi:hypothetical protein